MAEDVEVRTQQRAQPSTYQAPTMRRFLLSRNAVVGLAILTLTLASSLRAAELRPTSSAVPAQALVDVALLPGGVLQGQVVDAAGVPLAGAMVTLEFEGRPVATARTNAQGFFSIPGLHGGTFRVVAAGASGWYRLWAPSSAPPKANSGALLVAAGPANRGQDGGWITGPNLLGLGVLGGVVVGGVYVTKDLRSGS
jgi:hypothetical protein